MTWFSALCPARRSHKALRAALRTRLVLEQLEDRVTPSVLIPVSNRRDLVFDPTRNLLDITTASGQVQRYDVANQTLLGPWAVGTSLNGADITPDGSTLYAAENQTSGSQGILHRVNLSDGSVTNVTYNLASGEGGAWDVGIANNGKAFFSTRYNGSGWVPFRQLDLNTGTVTTRTDTHGSGGGGQVRQDTHIDHSADGSQMFMAESNFSNGPIFTYDAASNSFPQHAQTYAFYDYALSAVNRDGSLIATELGYGPSFFYGVSVMDKNFHSVHTLGTNFNGGLTFDPSRDLLYVADASAHQIVAIDTSTWAEQFRLDIGESVPAATPLGSGEMTVSSDGSELFMSTPSGVRMINLPASTGVASQLDVGGFPSYISAGTQGAFTVTARDPAGYVATGFTGTVHFSTTDPLAFLDQDYTFTADDNGVHTFHATFGTAGTFSITATDDADGLGGSQTNIRVHTDNTSVIPVLNRRDLVSDPSRGLLYITTSDGLVQRYDPASQTLLAPWHVGAELYGADITPDGVYLYTSEAVRGATQGMLHRVNLNDGTVTNFTYNLSFYEGGTWDVAIGNNGKALFDSRFEGSGWVPLRQIDLTTNAITARTDAPGSGGGGQIRQDTNIARAGDGSLQFLTESNISSGPILTYDPATDSFPHSANTWAFYGNAALAVNRDGSLIATQLGYGPPFPYGVSIMDKNFRSVHTLGPNFNGGLIFDPTRDLFYVADAAADQIVAFDTNTWAEQFRLNIGEAIPTFATFGSGEMSFSADDSQLFMSTPSGVRVLALPANPGVVSRFVVAGFPVFTGAGTPGTFTVSAVDAFGYAVPAYAGTVHFSSTDSSAQLPDDYPFTADDHGTHTFTATFNTPGTYTLRTEQADDATIFGTESNIVIHDSNLVSLIPVPNRRDLVTDPSRGLLYITTSDGLLQRYDPATQTLLAPWHVGVGLYGADITPDGAFLYATEAVRGATQGMLHKLNLADGTVTNLTYNLSGGEGGTWAVAIANNGIALFDSNFEGSGWMPLRQIDLSTDALSARTDAPGSGGGGQVRQNTHIRRGGDRSLLFLMESNISSGPIFDYAAASNTFPNHVDIQGFLDGSTGSVSRNGSLIAMKLGSDVRVTDPSLNLVVTLHNLGGGLVFDSTRDLLYAATSTQIIAYDTTTWAESYRFDIGQTVPAATPFGSGEMTVSDDGSLLFFSTPTGVRVYSLGGGGGGGHGGGNSPDPSLGNNSFRVGAGASAVDVAGLSVSIAPLGLGARPFTLPFEADAGGGVLPLAGLPFALVFESDTRVAVWGGAGHVDTLDAAGTAEDSRTEVLDGPTKSACQRFLAQDLAEVTLFSSTDRDSA
jgi:ribosomal protein L24E